VSLLGKMLAPVIPELLGDGYESLTRHSKLNTLSTRTRTKSSPSTCLPVLMPPVEGQNLGNQRR